MDKKSYALGMSIAHNMLGSGVKGINFDDFCAGINHGMTDFKASGQLYAGFNDSFVRAAAQDDLVAAFHICGKLFGLGLVGNDFHVRTAFLFSSKCQTMAARIPAPTK